MESKTKNLAIEGIIRDSIDVKKLGLTFVGKEYSTPLGRIDILAADGDGNKIPIEIKIGCAGDSAVGQVLGYMQAVGATRGIIMANEFSKRVEAVSPSLGIDLYPFRFDVIVSGESVVSSHGDIEAMKPDTNTPNIPNIQERLNMFTEECCDRTPNQCIEVRGFYHAFDIWHEEKYGVYIPKIGKDDPVPMPPNTRGVYYLSPTTEWWVRDGVDDDVLYFMDITLKNLCHGLDTSIYRYRDPNTGQWGEKGLKC